VESRRPDRDGHEHGSSRDELREQEAYAKRGVDFLDAPVFAADRNPPTPALDYGRGQQGIFEKVKPVLEHLGQTVHYFGKNGNAAAMKLVGNSRCVGNGSGWRKAWCSRSEGGLYLNTVMEVVKVATSAPPLLVSNGQKS